MARKGRRQRDIETAIMEAQVRYAPQLRTLTGLLDSLKGDLKSDLRFAKHTADAAVSLANRTKPALEAVYDREKGSRAATRAMLDADLAKLGAGADPLKAVHATESAAAANRVGSAAVEALRGLTSRQESAVAGAAYQQGAVRQGYRADRDKVLGQLTGVQEDMGAYVSGRVGDLSAKRATRKVQYAGQRRSTQKADADRRSREHIAAQKREDARRKKEAAKKPKWATPQQQGAAQDKIGTAVNAAQKIKGTGLSRNQAAQILLVGDSEAGIPKTNQLFASIALDLAYDGHISRRNVGELHKRRIKVKALGYPTGSKPTTGRPAGGT